jgi:Spy/CpxP family protein refolding chaperone
MKTTTRFAAVSLAVLALGVAGAVSAHPGAGMGYGMGYGMGHGMGPGAGAGPCMGYGPGPDAASAESAGCGMGPGMGRGMHGGMHGGMRGGMHGPDTPAVAAARLSDLKTELKITEAQEGAWQGFVAVVQQQAEQRQAMQAQMRARMQDPQAAPVDRAARHAEMTALRDAYFKARSEALTGLYAVLTPEQKALADQQLRGPYGHRMAQRGQNR